ncbi:MAG TPA: phage holin family protein [Thermoanaerobaculia bacterium]|nr:phage holin family protein [Thermoanaerobaculia bacterium]
MIRMLVQVALNGVGLLLTALFVPGIDWQGGLLALFLAGLVLGLVNLVVKPLVTLLSIPFLVVTLGLFYLLINAAMLGLVAWLLPDLTVAGCLPAVVGGVVLALFNWITGMITGR